MVMTSQPTNDSELQLYRVLQRANLLNYYDTFISQGIRLSSFGKIPLWRICVLAEAASQVHGIVGCFLSLCTDNFTWFAVASRKSLFFSAKLCTRGPLLPTPGLFQHLPRAKYPSVFSCRLKYSKLPRRLLHFGEQHACLAFLNIKQVVLGRWFGAGTDCKSLPFYRIKLFFAQLLKSTTCKEVECHVAQNPSSFDKLFVNCEQAGS